MTEVLIPGLSYDVTIDGRATRRRRASAINIETFHLRPANLRHDFGDKFAHLGWEAALE